MLHCPNQSIFAGIAEYSKNHETSVLESLAQLKVMPGKQIIFYELVGQNIVPEICRFLGIVISMYFDEHNPPHFHVRYNEYRAVMSIHTLNVIDGHLPAKVRGLVEEWAELHQDELILMWSTKEFHKLNPLV